MDERCEWGFVFIRIFLLIKYKSVFNRVLVVMVWILLGKDVL